MIYPIAKDLLRCMKKFEERCLIQSIEWCCDLMISLGIPENTNLLEEDDIMSDELIYTTDAIKIKFSRQLFYQKEYARAAHHLEHVKSLVGRFLYAYANFLNYDRKRWEFYLKNEGVIKFEKIFKPIEINYLYEMCLSVKDCDSYVLYVYSLIHKEMGHLSSAIIMLNKAIELDNFNWPAWRELALIISDYEKEKLPNNWMKPLFVLECFANLHSYYATDVQAAYIEVCRYNLQNSAYVKLKLAQLNNLKGDLEMAKSIFKNIRNMDPYNLKGIDIYSNILFSLHDVGSLSRLVKELFSHSKYTPEACFAAGNLYNSAGMHVHSANYFKQTLLLNPTWTHAWTLLGHEYIELRRLGCATVCYRKAIDMNPNEYRAWYGLGLVYELVRKPRDAVVMFEKALTFSPNDTRVLNAVATTSLKIGDSNRAKHVLRKCVEVGDQELNATFTLAGLVAQSNEEEAAALYLQFLKKFDETGFSKEENAAVATSYLMHYYFKTQQYQAAELYARRANRYNQCLAESEYILKQLDAIALKITYTAPLPTRSRLFLDQESSNSDEKQSDGDESDPMDLSFT